MKTKTPTKKPQAAPAQKKPAARPARPKATAAPRPQEPPALGALPKPLAAAVEAAFEDWRKGDKVSRLWARDAALWTGRDEARWLDWLGAADDRPARLEEFRRLSAEAASAGWERALLMGMGGSSLCAEVLGRTFGRVPGYPELIVLDSTDPAQVRAAEKDADPARTVFIVSSKSGTTLEPDLFRRYFYRHVREAVGERKAGAHFMAITDPGSKLQAIAAQESFFHVFPGLPGIGGRFSALSNFGLAPAAILGIDVGELLARAATMAEACRPSAPLAGNPGLVLGLILGAAHHAGIDKLTLVISPAIRALGAWIEQLVAESTGKDGKGIIPINGEEASGPSAYGGDRLFCYLRLGEKPDGAQDAAVEALERAGRPVVRIDVADLYGIAAEFFRWEMATAVAGSVIGVNPFDQPDVEASKAAARDLASEYERTGRLPDESPVHEDGGLRLFAGAKNAAVLGKAAGPRPSLESWIKAHLDGLGEGDYFALLAYLEMSAGNEAALQAIRHAVRDGKRVATCLGFGPRYLHSTGQAFKGGPPSGVFLEVTGRDDFDLAVPGRKFTFGAIKAAQARGDFKVLAERGRRALRVHIEGDLGEGLARIRAAVSRAVGK